MSSFHQWPSSGRSIRSFGTMQSWKAESLQTETPRAYCRDPAFSVSELRLSGRLGRCLGRRQPSRTLGIYLYVSYGTLSPHTVSSPQFCKGGVSLPITSPDLSLNWKCLLENSYIICPEIFTDTRVWLQQSSPESKEERCCRRGTNFEKDSDRKGQTLRKAATGREGEW